MTTESHDDHQPGSPLRLGSSEGLGAWLPIETAPRDGTWMLLAGGQCDFDEESDNKARPVVGQWSNELNCDETDWHWQFAWYDGGYYGVYEHPTHWMPLPTPPEAPNGPVELAPTARKET